MCAPWGHGAMAWLARARDVTAPRVQLLVHPSSANILEEGVRPALQNARKQQNPEAQPSPLAMPLPQTPTPPASCTQLEHDTKAPKLHIEVTCNELSEHYREKYLTKIQKEGREWLRDQISVFLQDLNAGECVKDPPPVPAAPPGSAEPYDYDDETDWCFWGLAIGLPVIVLLGALLFAFLYPRLSAY